MALKTFKPVTPSLRQLVIVDRSELYKGKPLKVAHRGQVVVRRPQQHGPRHRAVPRRRSQADLPDHRLQAAQARHAREGRADRVRSEPHLLHRPDHAIEDGEQATSSRRSVWRSATRSSPVQPGRREARQRHAARQHPGRHDRAQHRDEDRQGRGHRPLGRHLRADRRSRPGLRHRSPQLGRAAADPRPVLRHGGRGVEPRPHEHQLRQGRPSPLAGSASAQPRRDDEPGRSSARRRRGPHLGRPPPGHPVGQAHQGQEDAQSNKSTSQFIVASRHSRKKKG